MPKTEYTIEPGRQDIVSTVVLDAPRELVYRAYTDPKLFAQWWGPRQYENHVERFDIRRGGEWRVVQRSADGGEHPFRGVTHEAIAPELICQTFEYEPMAGHVGLQTATFEALGNKTRITAQIVFQSVTDRDGMVASGMQSGADESMERRSRTFARSARSSRARRRRRRKPSATACPPTPTRASWCTSPLSRATLACSRSATRTSTSR